ncbi:hypothetical protein F5X68DRAFT_226847 [Plectosphaerella plurivora]|uniref:DUF7708 domain-containing protein n=1 Tax=Plectosphaerella plurivora TaxID=936078 RepID=A0A9P8VNI1_9PEZI|nr:hypothetical protein F5X68DRAFT_226847 [Plectosphaerella plurivora]
MAVASENAKRFSQNNLHKLEQLDSQQKDFRKRIIGTQNFVAEQPALSVTSREAFEDFWKKVHGSKVVFDQKHEQGAGRLSRGATSLAASANEILRDVSPILELVRDFGAPFGGMAIGTICFVFAVAGNRQKMEEQIITTFASIRDRLPGIRVYQHIYNDDHELDNNLQSKILDAYDSFLGFCMAAFDFYTRGSLRRWTKTLQYTTDLNEQVLRVQKALVDVRLVCEDLLSKNVDAVKNSVNHLQVINAGLENEVERLTNEVQGLRLQLSELQANNDKEHVEKIAKLLGLWPFSDDTKHQDVIKHRGDVAAVFSQRNLRSRTTVAAQQSAIVGSIDYQEWLKSSDSRMLVLSGVNEYARTHHCWVSPIALNLIDKLTADNDEGGRDHCAFYLLGLRQQDDTWADVLAFLVYRLLELNKKALRDEKRCQELWSDLQSYSQAYLDASDIFRTSADKETRRPTMQRG